MNLSYIILQRIFIGLLVLSGLLVGKILSLIAPEEINKKRIPLLKSKQFYYLYSFLGISLAFVPMNYMIYISFIYFLIGLPVSILNKSNLKFYIKVSSLFLCLFLIISLIYLSFI
jgi:hypothetical protein